MSSLFMGVQFIYILYIILVHMTYKIFYCHFFILENAHTACEWGRWAEAERES